MTQPNATTTAAPTEGTPGAPPAAAAAPPAAPAAPTVTETAQQKVDDAFTGWDGKVETLPPAAQKIITDLRKENGDTRAAKNAETERVKAILKAAGIETDQDDPVKVLETTRGENTTLKQQNHQLRMQMALADAAERGGADKALLIPVLAHKGKLADLDPTQADFAQTLDALVKAEVDADPRLKAARAAAASGTPFGPAGGPGDTTDIDSQIAEATKAGNHRLAIALKRQKAYTGSA